MMNNEVQLKYFKQQLNNSQNADLSKNRSPLKDLNRALYIDCIAMLFKIYEFYLCPPSS